MKRLNPLTLPEQATPVSPATGFVTVFAKADGVYYIDDQGKTVGPLSAGVHVGATPPPSPSYNDLWLDTSDEEASSNTFSSTFGGNF
jgi:hypothetical protein